MDSRAGETGVEFILANKGAFEYLKSVMPILEDGELENKLYFLIPEKHLDKNEITDKMYTIWNTYSYRDREYDSEIISYSNNTWVMAISNAGKIESKLVKNPIILLNLMDSMEIPHTDILYLANSTLFALSDQELLNIITANEYNKDSYYMTNAYENYLFSWMVSKRNMTIGGVFLFILILLEGFILKSVLKYEYQLNAKELLLKKIHGESFFQRHRRILFILLLGWLVLTITVLMCRILDFSSTLYILTGGILIMCMEHLFVVMYSHKLDHMNVSKIFKGGVL